MPDWLHTTEQLIQQSFFYISTESLPMEGTSSKEEVASSAKFADQDYETLRQSSSSSGKLFVDPEFPPSAISEDVEWKRPSELVDDPEFFVEKATRFDVKQGTIH